MSLDREDITINHLKDVISPAWHVSLKMVHEICRNFSGAKYERIPKRENIPTVFLVFGDRDTRVLRFDLRKTEGYQVFFEHHQYVPVEIRDKFSIVPHSGTGWLGFTANMSSDADFQEKLSFMMEYWLVCTEGIKTGEIDSKFKTQQRMFVFARRAYPDILPLCNVKSIADMPFRPDIHFVEKKLIIEVDGAQHFKFIKFFQRNEDSFRGLQIRDRMLNEWCTSKGVAVLHIVKDAAALILDHIHFRSLCEETLAHSGIRYLISSTKLLKMISKGDFDIWLRERGE